MGIPLQEMGENLKDFFAGRGIMTTVEKCYQSPQELNYEFSVTALSSLSDFNRAVEELNFVCGYNYEKLPNGGFRITKTREHRQFISCGDCADSIQEAVSADPNGEQKTYICFGKGQEEFILTNFDECAHILVAGTTGSGKSVLLNSLIMQILCYSTANLVLIDPKSGAEFGLYEQDIHDRIENVCKDTSSALKWLEICVNEMEKRYNQMQAKGLKKYDGKRLVIVIDELADLMLTSKKAVEEYIVRIAQKGRASGIHLIVATQDPRASVVTSLIKYNLPTKVCLKTANIQHSMNVIDCGKAANLLDKGDGWVKLPNSPDLIRTQSPFITDQEITDIITGKYDK